MIRNEARHPAQPCAGEETSEGLRMGDRHPALQTALAVPTQLGVGLPQVPVGKLGGN